jgi:hypothetical protein
LVLILVLPAILLLAHIFKSMIKKAGITVFLFSPRQKKIANHPYEHNKKNNKK